MPHDERRRRRSPEEIGSKSDPMKAALATFRRPEAIGFADAWAGLEPTFSNAKAVRKWARMSAEEGGEDAFFEDGYMLKKQRSVARSIARRYSARRKRGDEACVFAHVELERDLDQWKVERQNLVFAWKEAGLSKFEVRFGLDPETFEFSIKPVPLAWLYDERFVRFLQEFVWDVPRKKGLAPSIAHGGGQFSLSAKTFLGGSLLADDIATRLDHPELSTWVMDYPNADDRAFRATRRRFEAFHRTIEEYWAGAFHPRASGVLTVEDAYLDRGFEPACSPPPGLVDPLHGPTGDTREIFQTNFAFARAIRLRAQNVHPGYWQSAHPMEDGYRADQIMRYSEGNLNRVQIAGELHVKSGHVLDAKDIQELDAPLDPSMLYDEASWENRAQMSRTSARDLVEAVLLDVHHAGWLAEHPHVAVRRSLAQDQLLGDAEETLARHAPRVLDELRRSARAENLAASRQRIKSDWIEPETLFWSAWKHLPPGEKAAIALEVVRGFIERVARAATKDPRRGAAHDSFVPADPGPADPMEPHRHRIHPQLWRALEKHPGALDADRAVQREWKAWRAGRKKYLGRRPAWSVTGAKAPWE